MKPKKSTIVDEDKANYARSLMEISIYPSSLTKKFRQRLDEKGIQKIFKNAIKMAVEEGFVSTRSLENVIVDTTIIEKNISHPTDAKLYHRAHKRLVKWCEKNYCPKTKNTHTPLKKTSS